MLKRFSLRTRKVGEQSGEISIGAGLIEHPHRRIERVQRLDHALVPVIDRAVIVEGAAALMRPRAGDRGNAARRMHVDRAVARAGKAVAEPEEGALVGGDQPCEFLDGLDRAAGDRGGPLRRPRLHMRFEFARRIGVAIEIIPVGSAVAEQAMHDRAGQRAVGAGLNQHRKIGLLHGAVHVDIDRDDLGAALLSRARRMRHHIDLGGDRVGAPDHHQIGLRHFARIGAGKPAGAGDETGPGRVHADGGLKAGIFLDVAQPVDAVAHHKAHRAGIEIGPHRFGAVARFGFQERFGGDVERVVPGDRLERARSLRALAAQRLRQSVRMMDALGITRDLRADHPGRVVIVLGAAQPPDALPVKHLDFQRTGRRTIVRTGRSADFKRGWLTDDLVHPSTMPSD